MYVMLWLAISRHAVFAVIALAAGIAFHIASMNFEWGVRYFTAPSAVLSFSLGALVYFFRKWQIVTIGPGATVAALAAWFGNMAAGGWLLPESYVFGAGYYLATICFTPGAWRGWQLIMVATPLLLAAGYGLSQLHDAFIEPVRRRVRDDGKPTPEFSQPCGIELATGSGRSTDRLGNQALQSRQIWP